MCKFPLPVMDMPVCVLGSVRVLAHACTGTYFFFRDASSSAFSSFLATILRIYLLEPCPLTLVLGFSI